MIDEPLSIRLPPRPRLDRPTIIRAALELLNEGGLDGLTTRRLAGRLSVQSPTLYWHVKNKRELLDLMASAILFRPPPGGFDFARPWWEWSADLARVIRLNLLEYRDGGRVVAGTGPNPALGPNGMPELFDRFARQGLERSDAGHVIASLSRFALGWTIDEQAARSRAPDGQPDVDFDGEFEFGLQALIEGLRLRLARP